MWYNQVKIDKRTLLNNSLDITLQPHRMENNMAACQLFLKSLYITYISHPEIFVHCSQFVVFCCHYISYTYLHIYICERFMISQQFHQTIIRIWQWYNPNGYRQTYHGNQTKRKATKQSPRRNSKYVMVYTLFEFDEKVKLYCTQLFTCF